MNCNLNKNMHKVLIVLVTMLMLMCCMQTKLSAEEINVQVDYSANARLKILKDNTVSFRNKSMSYTTFVVPSSVNIEGVDYTVSTIGKDAFNGKSLQTVIIPTTITTIKAKAFVGDNVLREIIIRSSNITFDRNAFKDINKSQITVIMDRKLVQWSDYKRIKQSLIRIGISRRNIDLRDCD